jgi:protein ImuB
LLARRERDKRALRSVALNAELDGGGTWRKEVCFREALDDPNRILVAMRPLLAGITGPPKSLGITVLRFGPIAADQTSLVEEPHAIKLGRLKEAVRQARAAAGPDAALRVVEVEPESRLPERRMALSPFEA